MLDQMAAVAEVVDAAEGRTHAAPDPWKLSDHDRATVGAAAQRYRYLFARFPEISGDDLVHEGLIAVQRGGHAYDPSKSERSTFVTMIAVRAFIGMARAHSRRMLREAKAARPEVTPPSSDEGERHADLADWCQMTLRGCRRVFGGRQCRIGRKFFRVSQVATMLLLQRRLELPTHAMRPLLQSRPKLVRALGFFHVPSNAYFRELARLMCKGRARLAAQSRN